MRSKQFAVTRGALAVVAFAIVIAIGNTPASASRIGLRRDAGPVAPRSAASAFAADEGRVLDDYAKLPVAFIENAGQTDARVRYYAQGNRFGFYLTETEVVVALTKAGADPGVALALRFLGANAHAAIEGGDRAPGEVNYFRGSDPSQWHTRLARYGQVTYRDLWPGINLLVREQAGVLKYEFHVRPGARPSDIRLLYGGAERLSLDRSGVLAIDTAAGVVHDAAPVAFQERNGARNAVQIRYALEDAGRSGRFGFAIDGAYDPDRELIVDPGIQYTTFLGGNSDDIGAGIAVDAAGNAYIGGTTQSPDFPATAGAFQRTGAPQNFAEAFVAKLNAQGSGLVYATFLGGSDMEFGRRIAIDAAGNAYITGQTKSSNFPTTANAFDRTLNIPANCPRCATDNTDGFVTKLNPAGSALVYSTYLGGTDYDSPRGIAVDAGGNAYVMGETLSPDFPTSSAAFDRTYNTNYDIFVTKLNAAGSALAYSTFIGGTQVDTGGGLAVNDAGEAYVSGGSGSLNFPTTPGAFGTPPDGSDNFVTKFNAAGTALVYSAVFGGTASDGAAGIALDSAGNAWIAGATGSTDYPTTANAADRSPNGGTDAFITELNPAGSALLYSTYHGGANTDVGTDVAIDNVGDVYVTGHTMSMDFPATVGAYDTVFAGDLNVFWGDAFVTKIDVSATTDAPPAPPATPGTPVLTSPGNGSAPSQPVGFSWTSVTSAASYTIQIDNSSAFTAPLEREATVTSAGFLASGLATTQHFWRVRGVNSAGVAGAWSGVFSFTPEPAPPPPTLATIDTNPTSVNGGTSSTSTVVLSTSAPEGGALVSLSSSNPAVASVPATTTVPAFSFTSTVSITTAAVSTSTVVTITGTYNGSTRSATLTVNPAGSSNSTLSNFTISPDSVTGGTSVQGVVVLSMSAQTPTTVSLSSSNGGVASVPASVTVPVGSQTAVFDIATTGVSASTPVTLSATLNAITRTATLTVTPGSASPPPPPPPQSATLTVSVSGRSGQTVRSSPSGINVGTNSSGSASFNVGTSITLSVAGGRSAIWSGACSSNGSKRTSCTFTLNASASVSAKVQ